MARVACCIILSLNVVFNIWRALVSDPQPSGSNSADAPLHETVDCVLFCHGEGYPRTQSHSWLLDYREQDSAAKVPMQGMHLVVYTPANVSLGG